MASTSKCPYCGGVVGSDEKNCPNCGAANELFVEDMPRTVFQPRTIEELKEYCAERGMPLLRMRFFIGEDYRQPKAFGIYRDGGNVVVYKNKADGSRAIRYRGPDEEHGVRELYLKLLEECHNRGIYPDGQPVSRSGGSAGGSRKKSRDNGKSILLMVLVWFMILGSLAGIRSCSHSKDGYYSNGNGSVYYRYGDDWYYSNDSTYGSWYYSSGFPESDYEDYGLGDTWDADWGVSNFKNSSAWDAIRESESSSSSSDYDSWDSSDTDWDSDW